MPFRKDRALTYRRTNPYPQIGVPTGMLYFAGAATTAGNPANTKGSWVELVSSTANNVAALELWSDDRVGSNGAFRGYLVDIGVGGSGSEVVVVPEVNVGGHYGGGEFQYACRYWLPIRIPAGSRIAARAQASLASDTYHPHGMLHYGTLFGRFNGYPVATTYGLTPGSKSTPTSDLSDDAWTQITSSTTKRHHAVTAHFSVTTATAMANGTSTVDVGVGGSGSEVVIGQYVVQSSSSETIVGVGGSWIEYDIPVGTRLSLRKNGTLPFAGNIIGWGY